MQPFHQSGESPLNNSFQIDNLFNDQESFIETLDTLEAITERQNLGNERITMEYEIMVLDRQYDLASQRISELEKINSEQSQKILRLQMELTELRNKNSKVEFIELQQEKCAENNSQHARKEKEEKESILVGDNCNQLGQEEHNDLHQDAPDEKLQDLQILFQMQMKCTNCGKYGKNYYWGSCLECGYKYKSL